jgi:Zn-finger nucleic acid-binding protein
MSQFHFFCAICGYAIKAEKQVVGGLKECPACKRVVPIPGYPATHGDSFDFLGVYRPEIMEVVMKFLCPSCRSKMSVDVRWEGRTAECPQCRTNFKVPMWSKLDEPLAASAPPEKPAPLVMPSLSADEIAFLSGPMATHAA